MLEIIITKLVAWAAWVTRVTLRNEKALDLLYYERRGFKGLRDRSIRGRVRRLMKRPDWWREQDND